MGQLVFLRSGGGGGGGGAGSLQSAYDGGRDIVMQYGRIQLLADPVPKGEPALLIGTTDNSNDISLLTLAKRNKDTGEGGGREPVVMVGNIAGYGPAIQTFQYPHTEDVGLYEDTDVVGLGIAYGGPTQAHRTNYSLKGIAWNRYPNEASISPDAALRFRPVRSQPELDIISGLPWNRSRVSLGFGNLDAAVARTVRNTLLDVDGVKTTFDVVHNLESYPVVAQVFEEYAGPSGPALKLLDTPEIHIIDSMNVEVRFPTAPAAGKVIYVAVVGY